MTPTSCLGTCSGTLSTSWPTGPSRSTSANEFSTRNGKLHPEGEGVLADGESGFTSGAIARKPDRQRGRRACGSCSGPPGTSGASRPGTHRHSAGRGRRSGHSGAGCRSQVHSQRARRTRACDDATKRLEAAMAVPPCHPITHIMPMTVRSFRPGWDTSKQNKCSLASRREPARGPHWSVRLEHVGRDRPVRPCLVMGGRGTPPRRWRN